jgi:hypothetical protein
MPQIAFRANQDFIDRIDRVVKAMQEDPRLDGAEVNRSSLLKSLVSRSMVLQERFFGLPLLGARDVGPEDALPFFEGQERSLKRLLHTAQEELDTVQAYIEEYKAQPKED